MNTAFLTVYRDDEGAHLALGDLDVLLTDTEVHQLIVALLMPGAAAVEVAFEQHSAIPTPSPDLFAPRPATGPSPSGAPVPSPISRASSEVLFTFDGRGSTPVPASCAEALALAGGEIRMVWACEEYAERLGVTKEEIQEICADPEEEWISDSAEVIYAISNGIGLTVSLRDGAVLAVRKADQMNRFRPRETPGTPRGRGGTGRRYPTDAKGLRELLLQRGFEVSHVKNGHYEVRRGPRAVQIPATPSDRRSLMNSIKSIERSFGESLAEDGHS